MAILNNKYNITSELNGYNFIIKVPSDSVYHIRFGTDMSWFAWNANSYLSDLNLDNFPNAFEKTLYMHWCFHCVKKWVRSTDTYCLCTGSPQCGSNTINMQNAYVNCRCISGNPVCGENTVNLSATYANCWNLTGSPVCGNNVVNMSNAYLQCKNLTGNPVCGKNVTNMAYTYSGCNNLSGNMFMYSNKVSNTVGMLGSHNSAYQLNIYTYMGSQTNTTLYANQVGCGAWTLDAGNNCYCNTTNNIYVYYNWNGEV